VPPRKQLNGQSKLTRVALRVKGQYVSPLDGARRHALHEPLREEQVQDQHGQVASTHSISAGLDYPSIGPEHAFLHDEGRVEYSSVSDGEALEAFQLLSQLEGIIPALESAHAVAHAIKVAGAMRREQIVIVNLSGRGDKDVDSVRACLESK